LILLGHSLGGLVASRFVSLQLRPVDALVMSSPALDPGLSALQKVLVATLPAIAPNLRVNNGLDPRFLSHDPAVVAAYQADPLVHPKISARLARFIATAGPATVAAAANWHVPTLLLYAGDDRLVNPAGSRAFAEVAGASAQVQPGILSAQVFESLYHEIFNEAPSGAAAVRAALKTWLDARF
jgi:alpha-beta hydrolase superfamily lysophospholipase